MCWVIRILLARFRQLKPQQRWYLHLIFGQITIQWLQCFICQIQPQEILFYITCCSSVVLMLFKDPFSPWWFQWHGGPQPPVIRCSLAIARALPKTTGSERALRPRATGFTGTCQNQETLSGCRERHHGDWSLGDFFWGSHSQLCIACHVPACLHFMALHCII